MLYHPIRFIASLILRLAFFPRFTGRENIPKKGGVILCSNHISYWDPIAVASGTRRKVRFMAKKELFEKRIAGLFFKGVNAFPVDRDKSDIASYKKALSLLKNGNVLGIFAQGTRDKDALNVSAKSGAAVFALKTGAVVVPVIISGRYKPFSRIKISYGEPLRFSINGQKPKRDDIEKATKAIEQSLNKV